MITEKEYALAEAYASEYTDARDFSTESARKAVWNGVRAGYLKAVEALACQPCKELFLVGTDGCTKCENGRVSVYRQGRLCLSCKTKSVKLTEKERG